ncbi:TPA: HTH-type transcriptional regulator EutR [Escherichia coli]|nr:HTH-type transcriptional regulator EutR [Escherichia coli]MBW9359240.1 HTH-type transcriptional regulator EutR [Escherichia coli]HDK0455077.1 HTH-type transcriptional regulator EutR [Escherichia coli]HDK1998559.1 HTH-type transcriptional regulator EutR [Escherichia coli]HDS0415010.1 HTH-type transcriptional regulator EutR [Escherichia coli]
MCAPNVTRHGLTCTRKGLTSEVVAAVAKICSNADLIYGAKKMPVIKKANTTIGIPGTFSARLQPNDTRDDVQSIAAQIYEGLSFGVGDAVIGVNPVTDDVENLSRVLDTIYGVIDKFNIPTQGCVLAHVTTQIEAIRRGAPGGLIFQSICGSEKGLKEFGVELAMLDEARAVGAEFNRIAGENCLYFETGQGSALSAGANFGADQVTMEARNYGLARHYDPFIVNTVVGFIGPEYLYNDRQIIRAGLEDHFMGKLSGISMGCVYEHALTITAWQQIYDQLHPGKFHGEFTEILLDDIQVFREYTGLALRQSCLVWPNSFWFGIPATRGEQGFIGSQCLGSAEIATRPGGTEFELSTPDDYTILGVVLSEDVITRQANFLHNPDRVLHMLRNQSALEVKEQHKAALWGFVQQALATFCENPENLHQPAVRKVLGDNLLMAMGAMLEEAQPMVTAESISHQSYRRLLSRAREYVLENMSEPVTVLDLCNQLHVSRRTLQNAFHAILGIGPNAWLKRIRLNAVRRELISPWSQSMTVKDAAMQWGFWHLGQFATDYQQLFSEKPSLTLHQRMREWG